MRLIQGKPKPSEHRIECGWCRHIMKKSEFHGINGFKKHECIPLRISRLTRECLHRLRGLKGGLNMNKLNRTMILSLVTVMCLISLGTSELLKLESTLVISGFGFIVTGIFTIISAFHKGR